MPFQKPSFEQFIRPAPCPVDVKTLEELRQGGHMNNVVALRVQMCIHRLLHEPGHSFDTSAFHQLQRVRGMAFSGFGPRQEDLLQSDERANACDGATAAAIRQFTEDIRRIIDEQAAHWKATGYRDELLLQHQDTDAVAELADTLGGRIFVSGSARLKEGMPDYDAARWIIATLVEGLPHPDGTTEQVITGAGPGIMEAGNRGAMEGVWKHLRSLLQESQDGTKDQEEVWSRIANFRRQIQSIGARIILPFEAGWNDHLQLNLTIKSFGPRKLALVSVAGGRSMRQPREKNTNGWHGRRPAMFSFTGGFGTADEDWELLTLAQCGKMQNPVPLFMVGPRKIEAMKRTLDSMEHDATIIPDDRKLVIFCEDEIAAVERYLEYHGLSPTSRIAAAIDERRGNLALRSDSSERNGFSSRPQ